MPCFAKMGLWYAAVKLCRPSTHLFGTKKVNFRARFHMASCGVCLDIYIYIYYIFFWRICFRLHKISWTESRGLFHKHWKQIQGIWILCCVLIGLERSSEPTKRNLMGFRLRLAGHHCGWVGYPKSSIVSPWSESNTTQTRNKTIWSSEAAVFFFGNLGLDPEFATLKTKKG